MLYFETFSILFGRAAYNPTDYATDIAIDELVGNVILFLRRKEFLTRGRTGYPSQDLILHCN